MAEPGGGVYRATYAVAERTAYGRWVRSLWQGKLPAGKALCCLREPEDLRGEVTAWGTWPHWTCLDVLTVSDPEAYARIVGEVCARFPPPALRPVKLRLYGQALVVRCESEGFAAINRALVERTRGVIDRAPLAPEEFDRAEQWIKDTGHQVRANLSVLQRARLHYLAAGSRPLPTSRYFRLAFLVQQVKALEHARRDRNAKQRHLAYFLAHGEPHWYASGSSLHTTLLSGLTCCDAANGGAQPARFTDLLWASVREALPGFRPRSLAIMGEAPRRQVTVRCFDWLTETVVTETRPGLRAVERAPFAAKRGSS